MGWRTFRVREKSDTVLFDDEMVCPASKEAGHSIDCNHCGSCCGSRSNRRNPVIINHGWAAVIANYKKGMKKIKAKKGWKREFPSLESVMPTEPVAVI